jgi:hypothetical protein
MRGCWQAVAVLLCAGGALAQRTTVSIDLGWRFFYGTPNDQCTTQFNQNYTVGVSEAGEGACCASGATSTFPTLTHPLGSPCTPAPWGVHNAGPLAPNIFICPEEPSVRSEVEVAPCLCARAIPWPARLQRFVWVWVFFLGGGGSRTFSATVWEVPPSPPRLRPARTRAVTHQAVKYGSTRTAPCPAGAAGSVCEVPFRPVVLVVRSSLKSANNIMQAPWASAKREMAGSPSRIQAVRFRPLPLLRYVRACVCRVWSSHAAKLNE